MELVVSHIIRDMGYYTTVYQADHAIAKHAEPVRIQLP